MSHSAKARTLIIFDVDGTLLDANGVDHESFDRAFRETTGVPLTSFVWTQFREVTARAIVHQALGEQWPDVSLTESQVKDLFLANLQEYHRQDATLISAFAGAVQLLSALKQHPEVSIAIATGCWRETAHFKLGAAGFDFADIPFACASDRYRRADIISLAAERAGVPVEQAIYVGDGPWDLEATRQLGIPFIGVGRRTHLLREAGARHTLEVLESEGLARILEEIGEG
jgi:phosphoglycolate phosphatase-like HAD superfamily hydrolase